VQVEVTTVLGFAGSALAFGVTVYIAILRYALSQKENELNRRFVEIETDVKDLTKAQAHALESFTSRLVDEEKATIGIDGEMKLLKNNHDALNNALEEIKRNMITKTEFEPRMTNLERTLNQILAELRGRSSYGSMAAVGTPAPPKPR